MATIAALTKSFDGTVGNVISNGNATTLLGVTNQTGLGVATFGADAQEGTACLDIDATGGLINEKISFTAVSLLWWGFYLKIPATAPVASVTLASWAGSADVQAGGNLRFLAGTTQLQLRDNNSQVYLSAAMTVGTWVRVAVRAQAANAAGHRLLVYTGANKHGTVPDIDSGAVTANSNASWVDVDTIHLGVINGTTTVSYDRVRGDDANEPGGIIVAPTAGDLIIDRS